MTRKRAKSRGRAYPHFRRAWGTHARDQRTKDKPGHSALVLSLERCNAERQTDGPFRKKNRRLGRVVQAKGPINDLDTDPGPLPTLPAAPSAGESVTLQLEGHPPYKDVHFSIRHPRHRHYSRFAALRDAAIRVMSGRSWYLGPVRLDLEVHARHLERPIIDSIGGVMDTLDGSHGQYFTYLPVAYLDDCQVCDGRTRYVEDTTTFYRLTLTFLADDEERKELQSSTR